MNGSREYPTYTYAFGVYLSLFAATKIVNCVPIFLDGIILIIKKVGEFSDIIVGTAPKFYDGFTTFFELVKALVTYIFWYFVTPICNVIVAIGNGLYWLCIYIWWGIQWVKNGFKWPEESVEVLPMLSDKKESDSCVQFDAARDSRNCYSFRRHNP